MALFDKLACGADVFSVFYTTLECDRQTDRQTPRNRIGLVMLMRDVYA